MKRLLPKLLCSLVALTLVSEIALADHDFVPRRAGFFERLFGIKPRPRRVEKRQRVFDDQAENSDDGFFFKPSRRKKSRVAIERKSIPLFGRRVVEKPRRIAKRPTQLAFADPRPVRNVVKKPIAVDRKGGSQVEDPEPIATLGMGNLPYLPARPVALFAENALSFNATSVEEIALRDLFINRNNGLMAEEKERAAIFAHYSGFGYKPLWTKEGKTTERAQLVLNTLASADDEGLIASEYLPSALPAFSTNLASLTFTPQEQAKFDVSLTIAALRYARHVSGGQFDPRKLSLYFDVKSNAAEAATVLRVLTFSPYPQQYLQSLAPSLQEYRLLKTELARLKENANTRFADGDTVKKDGRDPRILQLRDYLLSENYLKPGAALVIESDRDLMNAELSAALKSFQRAENIKATGALDLATVKKLNVDRSEERREAVLASMERTRWLPKNLGERHVFVNQASYDVNVVDRGETIWTSKVIVGKPLTQTYVFHDKMETVVFNPTWSLPQSIIMNEHLAKLRRNPAHFDKLGYEVFDKNGEKVKSKSIDWTKYDKGVPYNVIQPAGGDNALGELKFLFPNAHAIYMHDTPTRKLFSQSTRAFSHGCVRVQNPREFASVLLGWDRNKVDQILEEPETLNQAVPGTVDVHLTYFTAWPDRSGVVRYHRDIYERDQTLLAAIKRVKLQSAKLLPVAAATPQVAQQ